MNKLEKNLRDELMNPRNMSDEEINREAWAIIAKGPPADAVDLILYNRVKKILEQQDKRKT